MAIDLQEEREKRKQRRNHLNNIDEMIEIVDNIRTYKEQTSLRMKKAASYTRLRSSQPKSKSVSKNTKGIVLLKLRFMNLDSILNVRMRSINPSNHKSNKI